MSIPLEQLAMTCQTLRDARVLELSQRLYQSQQWNARLKPQMTDDYSIEMFLGGQFVHRVRVPMMHGENLQAFRDFVEALSVGKEGFYYINENYVIQLQDNWVELVDRDMAVKVPLAVILPILQEIYLA